MPATPHFLLGGALSSKASEVGSTGQTPDPDATVARISLLVVAVLGLYLAESVLGLTVFALVPEFFSEGHQVGFPGIFSVVVASVIALPLLRVRKIPVRARRAMGLGYVVVIAGLLSAGEVTRQWWIEGGRLGGLPWVTRWIVVVPLTIALGYRSIVWLAFVMSATPPLVLLASTMLFGLATAPPVAYTLLCQGNLEEAEELYRQMRGEDPDAVGHLGYLGIIAARAGRTAEARAIDDSLAAWDRAYSRGSHTRYRAGIAAWLGEKERAVALLQQAFREGRAFSTYLHTYPMLEPLWDYEPFEEFLKPKD